MIGLPEFNPEGGGHPGSADVAMLPDLVEALFSPTGPLSASQGLQHRPTQAEMALWVAQAFAGDQPLLYEAGTGVGKSL
ncbi:hypothetical protein RZS08_27460, partial [Arthrospira platensis SPKY1]|nr:hypothetical protein [Arthrospira platensis SPKY1]